MIDATQNPQNAKSEQVGQLLRKSLPNDEPMWPVDTFLRAELQRLRGDIGKAREAYRALAEWGTKDHYNDGWGGSGLSTIALWRWIEIANASSAIDRDELTRLLNCAQELQPTRLARGMYSTPILATLPQVEEESMRGLVRLAWKNDKKDEAARFLLDYLQIARTKELNQDEKEVWRELVANQHVSEDRLTLLVATRLSTLGQNEAAAPMFNGLLQSNDPEVRARAGYHLANIERTHGVRPQLLVDRLTAALGDAADPLLYQQILFTRAERRGGDTNGYVQDLQRLVSEFPNGSLADSAMYQVARYYQRAGDTDQALTYFGRLQNLEENNNRFELSYYQAALALYTRAAPGDLASAKALLETLLNKRPNAEVRLAALFWLGRFAEESADLQRAKDRFRLVIQQGPYDYYALRARMHLNLGPTARLALLPDQQTNAQLASDYQVKPAEVGFPADSPYASRLRDALQTGLYLRSFGAGERLRDIYPSQRLEVLTTRDLDSSHMLASISLLLAFREDSLAASDKHPQSRVQIALAVGKLGQDWQQAVSLSWKAASEPKTDPQQNATFLAAAYPNVFGEAFRAAATKYHLQPELLYAVVRRESRFYPAALSPSGLGLFQFIPHTFDKLDREWNLLKESHMPSREAFLLNPDQSIMLGAHYFRDKLLDENRGDILAALVEHNASRQILAGWRSELKTTKRSDDVEFAIESIPPLETRLFVKGALADMVIMTAAGGLASESRQSVLSPNSSH